MLSRNFLRLARFASSQASAQHYDIVIAGGGLVGTTFALALGLHFLVDFFLILKFVFLKFILNDPFENFIFF